MEIKQVNYLIPIIGDGATNKNGSFPAKNLKGDDVKNHIFLKLHGLKITKEKEYLDKEGNLKKRMVPITVEDIDLEKTPPYMSFATLTNVLYAKETANLPPSAPEKNELKQQLSTNKKEVPKAIDLIDFLLPSFLGLMGGYLKPSKIKENAHRDKAFRGGKIMLISGKGNFEQFCLANAVRDKKKEEEKDNKSASMYSTHTLHQVKWQAAPTVDIENLRFILACTALGKTVVTPEDLKNMAKKIENYLQKLNEEHNLRLKPEVDYGDFFKEISPARFYPKAGMYLNDDGIDVLLAELDKRLSEIYIKRGSGYAYVDSFIKDYNETIKTDRILRCRGNYASCNLEKTPDMFYKKYWVKGQ